MSATTEKKYLSPAEVARLAEVDRDTVYGWIVKGVRVVGGHRVQLQADQIGGRLRISPAAWEQFKTACNRRTVQTPAEQEQRGRADAQAARWAAEEVAKREAARKGPRRGKPSDN